MLFKYRVFAALKLLTYSKLSFWNPPQNDLICDWFMCFTVHSDTTISVLAKSANKKKLKVNMGVKKCKIRCWFWIRRINVKLLTPRKLKAENFCTQHSFSLKTLIAWTFLQPFQRVRNYHLRYLIPMLNFCKIIVLCHMSTFCKFWSQTSSKRLEKTKKPFFYNCIFKLNHQPA
jgi:hypothetical protein